MDLIFHLFLGFVALVVALAAGWMLLILLDVFVFPRWTPWRGFDPVCWLFGHIDDDADEDEDDCGLCQRCGAVWTLGGGR